MPLTFLRKAINLELAGFLSRRVVTAEGIRPAAIVVEGEKIREVVALEQIPGNVEIQDFGEAAILPGLVDSHVHINEPGRTEWEGFGTATRAAAAGGYTMLVDMPLNCLPGHDHRGRARSEAGSSAGKMPGGLGRVGRCGRR